MVCLPYSVSLIYQHSLYGWWGGGSSIVGIAIATGWTVRSLNHSGGQEIFFSPYLSRPVLGPTQPSLQWELAHFPGGTALGAWIRSPIPI